MCLSFYWIHLVRYRFCMRSHSLIEEGLCEEFCSASFVAGASRNSSDASFFDLFCSESKPSRAPEWPVARLVRKGFPNGPHVRIVSPKQEQTWPRSTPSPRAPMVFLGCRFRLLSLLFKVFVAGSFALHKQCQMLRTQTHFFLIYYPSMFYRGLEACFERRLRSRRNRDNAIILTPRQWIDSNSSAISASY
jgi:hypothetical protein